MTRYRGGVSPEEIEAVAEEVLRSRKYRHVLREVVLRLAEQALGAQHRDPDEAVHSVKRALHQAYGAFGGGGFPWQRMRRELEAALGSRGAERVQALSSLMRHHASTRERAPIVEAFYARLFAEGVPRSVLDLGCGLNGLSIPLWPRGEVRYFGADLDARLLSFVDDALTALCVPHELSSMDLLGETSLPATELALMLKLYTTLEQQVPGSAARLIERVPASRVVVSFPTRSLGKRDRGMTAHHRARFCELADARGFRTRELSFDSELVFVLDK